LETHSSKITSAIESLRSLDSNSVDKKRGFGTSISTLLDYLCDFANLKYGKNLLTLLIVLVRILSFLCGAPNHGKGNLKMPKEQMDYNISPQFGFYKEQVNIYKIKTYNSRQKEQQKVESV
jgi:hypothetical protein